MKKYFFGWENIKWLVKEIGNMYSSKKSFFSKKRIESGLAFIIGQWGMIFFLLENQLTAEDEELTPTMKLKRREVDSKYSAYYENWYGLKDFVVNG